MAAARCFARLPVAADLVFEHHRSRFVSLIALLDLASIFLPVLAATVSDDFSSTCADAAAEMGLSGPAQTAGPALLIFRIAYIATALAASSKHYRLAIWAPLSLVFGSTYALLLFSIEAPACAWLADRGLALSDNAAPLRTVASVRIFFVVATALVVARIATLLVAAWRNRGWIREGQDAPTLQSGAPVAARLVAASLIVAAAARRLSELVPFRHKLAVAVAALIIALAYGFVAAAAAAAAGVVSEEFPPQLSGPLLHLVRGVEVGAGLALGATIVLLIDSCAVVAADVAALRARDWSGGRGGSGASLPPTFPPAPAPETSSLAAESGYAAAPAGPADELAGAPTEPGGAAGAAGEGAQPPRAPTEGEGDTKARAGTGGFDDDTVVLISDPDAAPTEGPAGAAGVPGETWQASLVATLKEGVSLRYRAVPGTLRKTPGFTADGCVDVTHAATYAAASDYLMLFATNAALAFAMAASAFTALAWALIFETTRNWLLELLLLQLIILVLRRVILWAVTRATTRGNAITQPRLLVFLDVLLSFTSGVVYGVSSGAGRAVVASVIAAVSATRLSRPCLPARFALYDPAFRAYVAMLKCSCAGLLVAADPPEGAAASSPPLPVLTARSLDDDHADVLATFSGAAALAQRGWAAAAALPAALLQPPPPASTAAAAAPAPDGTAAAPAAAAEPPEPLRPVPSARAPRAPWGSPTAAPMLSQQAASEAGEAGAAEEGAPQRGGAGGGFAAASLFAIAEEPTL